MQVFTACHDRSPRETVPFRIRDGGVLYFQGKILITLIFLGLVTAYHPV